jgi:hypothetical protein
MSSLGDLISGLGNDNTSAITLAGDVFGVVSAGFGAISAGVSVAQLLGIVQSQDQMVLQALSSIETTIDTDFRQLTNDVAANGILDKERDIDLGINDASTIFALLQTYVQNLPSLGETFILDKIQTCVAAVQFFTDYDDKWVIPWGSLVQYQDAWSGTLVPAQTDYVFNYTYVLPQFLRAIYFLQSAIFALQPPLLTAPDIQAIFAKCSARLQPVHDTIMNGIISTRLPTTADVAYVGISADIEVWKSLWYGQQTSLSTPSWDSPDLWPFGAVDIYTSRNNVQSYSPFMPYEFEPDDPGPLPESFCSLVRLRIVDCMKELYITLGLPVVRDAIRSLQVLTSQPVGSGVPYDWWSLRNAASLLGLPQSGSGQAAFWTTLQDLLLQTPPYTGGDLFPVEAQQTYPRTPLPVSFRSLFTPA